MNLQRIFSQNKADDAANPLWIGKDNLVAPTTQLCGNIAFSLKKSENAISQRCNRCATA
jgi:hypothetical protein